MFSFARNVNPRRIQNRQTEKGSTRAYPQIDPLVGFGLVGLRQLAEPRVGYLSGAA